MSFYVLQAGWVFTAGCFGMSIFYSRRTIKNIEARDRD